MSVLTLAIRILKLNLIVTLGQRMNAAYFNKPSLQSSTIVPVLFNHKTHHNIILQLLPNITQTADRTLNIFQPCLFGLLAGAF